MEDPLDELFWRDEILQIMYWMHGEGLGSAVAPHELVVFLDAEESFVQEQLERLVKDGFARRADGGGAGYQLTELGIQEGGRRFTDEFSEMTNKGHGQCNDPTCVCQADGPEACIVHTH